VRRLCEELLATWCDALLARQVRGIDDPGIDGGIMCPEQSRIPARLRIAAR
jgi:hypothetical protein